MVATVAMVSVGAIESRSNREDEKDEERGSEL